jgi:hypothetical protein
MYGSLNRPIATSHTHLLFLPPLCDLFLTQSVVFLFHDLDLLPGYVSLHGGEGSPSPWAI